MIAHTIETAHACRCVDRVVVSTEDPEIAEAGRIAGAEISARPASLVTMTDAAGVVDVCLDLLATEERAGRSYDVFACLYATAPLRRADDVAAVMRCLRASTPILPWLLQPSQLLSTKR
jgi:pseudaminic acid cytidylyltransferase